MKLLFRRFGECGVLFHYSHVHSDTGGLATAEVQSIDQIDLFANYLYLIGIPETAFKNSS